MAFTPGFNSRFFVGSQRWSLYARAMSATVSAEQIDVSSMEDLARVFANGQKNGTAQLDMMLDGVGAGQFALANTWQSTQQPLTLGFDGCDLSDVVWLIAGNQSSATIGDTLNDVATIGISVQPDGPIDWGVMIAAEGAITVDTDGTSVDNGASSANGGVAHLHTTAYSGLTSNSVIIEHSTNNSVWATLATFASVTAVGSERLVVAAGTTVNRYLRIRDDVTGTGSTTRAVSFARR
jgi:hypothetical protein